MLRNDAAGAAVEVEVAALRGRHADTDDGRQRLVRRGHLPEREIMTGIGPVAVRYPRATGLAKARAHQFFLGDLAALRAPLEEPSRCSKRHLRSASSSGTNTRGAPQTAPRSSGPRNGRHSVP